MKERFNLNDKPQPLPSSPEHIWRFLGVPLESQTFVHTSRLTEQYELHRYKFHSLERTSPELGALGLLHWSQSVSSCCVERLLSTLTQIDTSNRQSMRYSTLYNTLFLRGNWRVVRDILDECAELQRNERTERTDTHRGLHEASKKRSSHASAMNTHRLPPSKKQKETETTGNT